MGTDRQREVDVDFNAQELMITATYDAVFIRSQELQHCGRSRIGVYNRRYQTGQRRRSLREHSRKVFLPGLVLPSALLPFRFLLS